MIALRQDLVSARLSAHSRYRALNRRRVLKRRWVLNRWRVLRFENPRKFQPSREGFNGSQHLSHTTHVKAIRFDVGVRQTLGHRLVSSAQRSRRACTRCLSTAHPYTIGSFLQRGDTSGRAAWPLSGSILFPPTCSALATISVKETMVRARRCSVAMAFVQARHVFSLRKPMILSLIHI